MARFDYTISSKDSLFVRYVKDAADTILPFLGSPIAPRWPEVGVTRNNFATVEYRRVISPSLINLLRFGLPGHAKQITSSTRIRLPRSTSSSRGQNGGVSITGLSALGTSIYAPLLEVQNKFPLADEVFWTKELTASALAAPSTASRATSSSRDGGAGYIIPSLTNFLEGSPSLFQGPEPGQTDSERDFREIEIDSYIHDEWRVKPKLTVNIGLRYEFVTNPTTNLQPLNAVINPPFGTYQKVTHVFGSNPSLHNFDPRIGLAYDPFGDHKTSIRVGAGIFYEPIHARTYASGYYFNPPYALAFVPLRLFPIPFPACCLLPPSLSEWTTTFITRHTCINGISIFSASCSRRPL